MTTAAAIREALAPAVASAERFSIRAAVAGAFVARAPSSRACLLVPTCAVGARPVGRVSGSLSVTFPATVLFDVSGRQWEAPCAVIECLDEGLLPAFCALSVDVAERLTAEGRTPSPADVAAALADWERLLRSRRRLSDTEEMGLWGELAFVDRMPDVDAAIRCWRGPFGDPVDFLGAGVGLECKTTKIRLQHHVSLSQVLRPLGDVPVYLVSQWAGIDAQAGRTVSDLVDGIAGRTTETVALERALLAVGYSRADAALYKARFVLLEAAHWFAESDVPSIRQMDTGITQVRYVVQLDELRGLEDAEAQALERRLVIPP